MTVDTTKARSIFSAAVENHSPDQWGKFLDDACGEDIALRRRVELLLVAHQGEDSFLDRGNDDASAEVTFIRPVTEQPGDTIGPYKLLQQIGEGGMGTVFMAEQTEPVERRVALKIIKPGMDTQQVIARFEAERQALAMMDHPNIAKVLDAGTTDSGRPYFVMELVKGIPVTKYCDQEHLTVKERLELFLPICQAIQHAHQKGIIHRDVKPTNILVARYDGKPVPKVIDFGVAKATSHRLTEKTMFTQYGQIVGTIEYMSPEQAEFNQLDIDTRSDIYSLGVLLYELLTGETPFDKQRLRSAAFDELLRIIREEEPPRPSTKLSGSRSLPNTAVNRKIEPRKLSLLVRGELDWIVMKALEKDRNRRYETATSFANDIQHYLNDEAVVACPPSAAYKFRKFARRNKIAIGTTAAIAASLIAGIIGTSWQAYRATKAEGLARQEAERATKAEGIAEERLAIVESQKEEIEQEKQNAITEAKRADKEAAISKAVNDFLNEDLLGMAEAESQAEADLTPNPNITLRTVLDRAAESIEGRFADRPLVEAAIHYTIGAAYISIGVYDEAEQHSQRALQLRTQELGQDHSVTLKSMCCLAHLYSNQGRYLKAEQLLQKTVEHSAHTLGSQHPVTLTSMSSLAKVYTLRGRYAEAITLNQQTLDILQRTLGDDHPETLESMTRLANVYDYEGRHTEAAKLHQKTLELKRKVLGEHHPSTLGSMNSLACVYQRQSRHTEAEQLYQKTLELRRNMLGNQHPDTLSSMNNLANLWRDQGQDVEAEQLLQETLEIKRQTLGEEHPDTLRTVHNLACVYSDQSRYIDAEQLFQKTLDVRRQVIGVEHPNTLHTMNNLANIKYHMGKQKEAVDIWRKVAELDPESPAATTFVWQIVTRADRPQEEYAEALQVAAELAERKPEVANHLDNLGVAQYRNQQWDAAVESLEKAREMRGGNDLTHEGVLAMAYWQLGEREQARKVLDKVVAMLELRNARRGDAVKFRDEAEKLFGLSLTGEERQQIALEYAARQLQENPDDTTLLFWRGKRFLEWQRYQEAEADLSRLVELKPDDHKAQVTLARVCNYLKEYDRAIEACNIALQLDPEDAYAYFQRGAAYLQQKKYSAALADLEKSIELNPDFPWTYQKRGSLYAEQREWAKALADLHTVQQLLPERRQEFSKQIALLMLATDEHESYRRLCEKLSSEYKQTSNPRIAQTLLDCALLAPDALKDSSLLVQIAKSNQKENSDNKKALTWLAAAHYRSGNLTAALRQSETNHAQGKSGLRNWLWLAMARIHAGQIDTACERLDDVEVWLESDPNTSWAFRLEVELLRQEAEHLLNAPEKAVASEDPETPEEETP